MQILMFKMRELRGNYKSETDFAIYTKSQNKKK